MKYLLFLLLPVWLFAQEVVSNKVTTSRYTQITLDSTTTTAVYFLYRESGSGAGDWYLSTSAPTAAYKQPTNKKSIGSGGLTISVFTEYVTAEESDSLYATVQSYIWDNSKAGYYPSTNDIFYLVFDTFGTYTQGTIDYLDWTNNSLYTANLGGVIMPGTGLKITFGQNTDDTADADTKLSIGVHVLQ